MALGPGRYDPECTEVMVAHHAEVVLLVVIGGKKGSGFACQATPELAMSLPALEGDEVRTAFTDDIRDAG